MPRHLRLAAIPFLAAALLLVPTDRVLIAAGAPQNAAPATVAAILKSQGLSNAYNPVLLEYLLREGRPKLRAADHKQAVDQLVTRFRQEMTVTGTEQVMASAATLGGVFSSGVVGEGLADGAASVWAGWVQAALVMTRAGYKADTIPFFERCMATFPYEGLRRDCAVGLFLADSNRAFTFLLGQLERRDTEMNQLALRLLGLLAGDKACPPDKRTKAVEAIIAKTDGMMNTSLFSAAIDGLMLARDRRAIEPLKKLTGGFGKSTEVKRLAKRALLLTFKDTSVLPDLEKEVKGGMTKSDEGVMFAGSLLIEGGYDAGYVWAREKLAKKPGGVSKLFNKEDPNALADIAWVLIERGGAKSIPVLQAAVPVRKPDEFITAYMAIGLLRLGDKSAIEIVRASLTNKKWLATRLRAAEALAKAGDLSGIAALDAMVQDKSLGSKAADLALGRFRSASDVKSAVAYSLATIDKPGSVPVLINLLSDNSADVRTAAAYSLASMKTPTAIEGLSKAIGLDYGKSAGRVRGPEVEAHVLRVALARFPKDARTTAMARQAVKSEWLSVRFLGLVAS
jgi:hypothetical protein